jgi:hypothetical protein
VNVFARLAVLGLIACVLGPRVSAQEGRAPDDDLTLPPRLDEGPGASRLALPERPTVLEEVIVVNESEWRLPDLGSTWRQREEAADGNDGRIAVSLFPLYDPERLRPDEDLFPRSREMKRVGFIELFRIEFGDRQ